MVQPNPRPDHGASESIDARIVSFSEARRVVERRAKEPEFPIEEYLLTEEGMTAMSELYGDVDECEEIIMTVASEISLARRHNQSTIYTLFQDKAGGQGLTRLELVDLYDTNPLIKATLAAIHRKRNKGDDRAKHLYTYGLRVFMNMVRYEWLNRAYDPHDPAWLDRASRLGDYDSGIYNVHLQPGHNRQDVVTRQRRPVEEMPDSPSDYLDLPPK